MNIFSPTEIVENYSEVGAKKTAAPINKQLLLAVLAGFLIGMGASVTNTASYTLDNASVIRIVSGLLFPFGLAIVSLMGAELFTGNCMIPVSVIQRKATVVKMLINWCAVYVGNFIGAFLLAVGCAYFGQLGQSDGMLAVYTIKVATAKASLPFDNAIVLGILCNLLVCLGVLCAMSAKDTSGKILGSYIPVAFFVICGFEHCVANMYYIPAGLLAMNNSSYALKAAEHGINTSNLTWGNFLYNNLLPVTIGNILGGVAIGLLMWFCFLRKGKS